MIKVAGADIDQEKFMEQYTPGSVERSIATILSSSSAYYPYNSMEQMKLEIDLRSRIVAAAKDLYRSRFSFEVFRKSECNPNYWNRTDEGGFECRSDVRPSDAIRDIFINGRQYATECATAIVIVFYKAVLDVLLEDQFNRIYTGIYLMNWQHVDRKLGVEVYQKLPDSLPGDCRYFKNPDVDPLTPEWQGENVIDMGEGLFYGHGIGIRPEEGIIDALNRHRKEDAQVPAYLMDQVTMLDFEKIGELYL